LVKNYWLSQKYNCQVYLKLETLQPVGSFKLRGALNKISHLSDLEKKKGVLAVSAGNHAQGVAYAANKYGVQAHIIMPVNSPLTKIMATEALGAKVTLHGENVEESFQYAQKILKKEDVVYVHPFKDPMVIAGQATMGLEIIEELNQVDYIIGSIGGGGLMSGIGLAFKQNSHPAKVIGVQAQGANSMVKSLQSGKIESTGKSETFADGIKVAIADEEMFQLLDSVIDDALSVKDNKIAEAVLDLIEKARIVSEGAGAITLAAFDELFQSNPRRFKNKNIVLLICGGNIDINLIDRIIDRGLVESHRRSKISVSLPDTPGSLGQLTTDISDLGANILQVMHNREAPDLSFKESVVEVILETRDGEHLDKILKFIAKKYPKVETE
jgi:threonine dehydratase